MASLRKVGKTYYIRYRINSKEFSKKFKDISKSVVQKLPRQFEETLAGKKLSERA